MKLTLARQAGKMTNRSDFTDCNTIRPSHTYALKEKGGGRQGERGVTECSGVKCGMGKYHLEVK